MKHSNAVRIAAFIAVPLLAYACAASPAFAVSFTAEQVSAIVSLLQKYNIDAATISQITTDLNGGSGASGVGSVTPACPALPITHDLTVGSTDAAKGGDVSRIQTLVGISPTGYFGSITKKAVIAWQAAHGVSATGYVGPLTRAAIQSACGAPGGSPSVSFTAAPTTGTAPLAVTFSVSGSGLGNGDYIIDYGDNANSGSIKSYCASGNDCTLTASHTYQSSGVYTASLSPYIACLWATPRCLVATQLLGSATITVGAAAPASTLSVPGSVTLSPGGTATYTASYSTLKLTLNSVSFPSGSGSSQIAANFTWSETNCGTAGCLGAVNPAAQQFTLYLSGGSSSYTSALGYTIALSAASTNSATVSVSK